MKIHFMGQIKYFCNPGKPGKPVHDVVWTLKPLNNVVQRRKVL